MRKSCEGMNMGLTNKGQAILLGIAAFLVTLGTATATIPNIVPDNARVPISIFFWVCGIIGFALKEAAGSAYPQTDTSEPAAQNPT
jgi:hypothetical protein